MAIPPARPRGVAFRQIGVERKTKGGAGSRNGQSLNVREPEVQNKLPFPGFRDTAFTENRDRSLHRWVPWIAGFSATFVNDVLDKVAARAPGRLTVLDPFAGVGTTLIEALKRGHDTIGFEINPYAALACEVKVRAADYDVPYAQRKNSGVSGIYGHRQEGKLPLACWALQVACRSSAWTWNAKSSLSSTSFKGKTSRGFAICSASLSVP